MSLNNFYSIWKLFVFNFIVFGIISHSYLNVVGHEAMIRCRLCGSSVAKTSNYIQNPDPSHARDERSEKSLVPDGTIYTYRNPAQNEFDVAMFSKANGDTSSVFTEEGTFFDQYSWRILSCSNCKHHLGWHYRHTDLEKCYSSGQKTVVATKEKEVKDANTLLANMRNVCVQLNEGWWTYRYCHLDEIRQFHAEQDNTISMDWSLGKYDHQKERRGIDDLGNPFFSFSFVHGQRCDENNDHRQTNVNIMCCRKEMDLGIHIRDIKEPEICKYIMNICLPDLCGDVSAKEIETNPNVIKHRSSCDSEFDVNHPGKLGEFYALIWPNTVSEDSDELAWTKELRTITALSR